MRRLEQLERNLADDLRGLADPGTLRRQAEALLAFGHALEAGAESVELPDPWEPDVRRVIALDPRRSGRANADRLFEKARRAERAAREVELRLRETAALAEARAIEAKAEGARDAGSLPGAGRRAGEPAGGGPGGPRHYLTGRGLSVSSAAAPARTTT
ncbi:MAG: NFACT family protein [Vicinamibacteria bacterium]